MSRSRRDTPAIDDERAHGTTTEARGGARTSGLEEIDGEQWYTIADVDRMAPFLTSLVSDGDHWMFVSSSGALTAGRGDANHAVFPYVTDDRLHASGGRSGPVTRLRVSSGGEEIQWAPFEGRAGVGTRRFLSKSVVGDSIVFEEHRVDLGMRFRYRWNSSAGFGFVRTATLANDRPDSVDIAVLDGLVDLLPFGLEPAVYQRLGNLTNAYKRSELIDPAARLAVYSLEAPVSDRPEPEEVLRGTVVWSVGVDGPITLDSTAVDRFEVGEERTATLVTGRPGAYLVRSDLQLGPGTSTTWRIVADVAHDQCDVVRLGRTLTSANDVTTELVEASDRTRRHLVAVMAAADASQITGDALACAHHVANVTYNVMRGGVPLDGYRVDMADFVEFVRRRNRRVADSHAAVFASFPEQLDRRDLLDRIETVVHETGDVHLTRLGDEYLPFSFSRRHGDPSRPWNQFSIRVIDDDGEPVIYYEGNWRDLFQNWEAMCASHPGYLPGVVTLFVNASTADGHNPYRITRDGVDWEVPDPDDPWSNIGYWGDHQVVYLLRLLEATERHRPGEIGRRLDARVYTYVDVPYRIASYGDLLRDPKATIEFDERADVRAHARVADLGGDGRLLVGHDDRIVVVTLLEKLLVPALAKLSNFVPGGGIWMNTQRPEWNDANNALVGHGLSMVTLFHLRRYLDHLRSVVAVHGRETSVPVSTEVASWFAAVSEVLSVAPTGRDTDPDRQRRNLMDRLGRAASEYRSVIYSAGFSGAVTEVRWDAIVQLCDVAIEHLDETIRANWRADGLVHSYNIIHLPTDDTATVSHLPEMLEGQVAALSACVLSAERQADLVDRLFESSLVRADLGTFLLAPPRRPPGFLDKNVIAAHDADGNALLSRLVAAGDRSLIRTDANGTHRFAPDITTEDTLRSALAHLGRTAPWSTLVDRHGDDVIGVYETVFGHRSYVGRSGSMYAYEGIGSIYWHMVAKLLLAVQECASDALVAGEDGHHVERLRAAYWRVRAGLGVNKSAVEFGAFPTDPYSHSPAHAGAQQPGMTGAVKEEILARPRELGVSVVAGRVEFDSLLLRAEELLDAPARWTVPVIGSHDAVVDVPAGGLGCTVCQVPVIISVTDGDPYVEVESIDGRINRHDGHRLSDADSAAIFRRSGEVRLVRAAVRRYDA